MAKRSSENNQQSREEYDALSSSSSSNINNFHQGSFSRATDLSSRRSVRSRFSAAEDARSTAAVDAQQQQHPSTTTTKNTDNNTSTTGHGPPAVITEEDFLECLTRGATADRERGVLVDPVALYAFCRQFQIQQCEKQQQQAVVAVAVAAAAAPTARTESNPTNNTNANNTTNTKSLLLFPAVAHFPTSSSTSQAIATINSNPAPTSVVPFAFSAPGPPNNNNATNNNFIINNSNIDDEDDAATKALAAEQEALPAIAVQDDPNWTTLVGTNSQKLAQYGPVKMYHLSDSQPATWESCGGAGSVRLQRSTNSDTNAVVRFVLRANTATAQVLVNMILDPHAVQKSTLVLEAPPSNSTSKKQLGVVAFFGINDAQRGYESFKIRTNWPLAQALHAAMRHAVGLE